MRIDTTRRRIIIDRPDLKVACIVTHDNELFGLCITSVDDHPSDLASAVSRLQE